MHRLTTDYCSHIGIDTCGVSYHIGNIGYPSNPNTPAGYEMDVVGLNHVDAFIKKHQECRQELSELIRELEAASFATPLELSARYPSCKILDGRTVVFKVRGNKYRLSAKIAFNTQKLIILAMETHAEYDRRTLR